MKGTSAQLVITSYDQKKTKQGLEAIRAKSGILKIEMGRPKTQAVRLSKDKPAIWGCEGRDLKRLSVEVSGSTEALAKLVSIKTIEGVYMQLLVKKQTA